jgi:hypothetical protein
LKTRPDPKTPFMARGPFRGRFGGRPGAFARRRGRRPGRRIAQGDFGRALFALTPSRAFSRALWRAFSKALSRAASKAPIEAGPCPLLRRLFSRGAGLESLGKGRWSAWAPPQEAPPQEARQRGRSRIPLNAHSARVPDVCEKRAVDKARARTIQRPVSGHSKGPPTPTKGVRLPGPSRRAYLPGPVDLRPFSRGTGPHGVFGDRRTAPKGGSRT